MVRELRAYDPKPGCRFVTKRAGGDHARRLRPANASGGWVVELNNAALPRLLVNRRYYAELKRGPQDKASKAWLSECLANANWLVKALDQRARTIVKVATEIVKQQEGFFEQGVSRSEAADPARKVAEAIEMHESTVSRVTSNKYLAVRPRACSSSNISSARASPATRRRRRRSAEAVKAAIGKLIAAESRRF